MIAEPTTEIAETALLYRQVTEWAEEQGWTVTPEIPRELQPYASQFPEKTGLKIETDTGTIHLAPRGRRWNKCFYVELYAYPTLLGVWLKNEPKSEVWQYVTDGGIPFHWTWNKDTFVRLVRDLNQLP